MFTLLAVLQSASKIYGYRLLTQRSLAPNYFFVDMVSDLCIKNIADYGCTNATIDPATGNLVGTQCSLDKLPLISLDNGVITIDKDRLMILGVGVRDSERIFKFTDARGYVNYMPEKWLAHIASKRGLSNAKLVRYKLVDRIVALKGEFKVITQELD